MIPMWHLIWWISCCLFTTCRDYELSHNNMHLSSSASCLLDFAGTVSSIWLFLQFNAAVLCFQVSHLFCFSSVVSLEVQITPTHGEISLGESKFFMCEGKVRPPSVIGIFCTPLKMWDRKSVSSCLILADIKLGTAGIGPRWCEQSSFLSLGIWQVRIFSIPSS